MKYLLAVLIAFIPLQVAKAAEGEPIFATAFCLDTPENVEAMQDIHKRWDTGAFAALMSDEKSGCFAFPDPIFGMLTQVSKPFMAGGNRCLVYKYFVADDVKAFTWAPCPGQGI
jgi:hypothetical protein